MNALLESGPHAVCLGAEYDEILLGILAMVLQGEHAEQVDQLWGVGGSQEITVKEFRIGRETLRVRTETYDGTTLHGPEPLVERIAHAVRERLATAPLHTRGIALYEVPWPPPWEAATREMSPALDARSEAWLPQDHPLRRRFLRAIARHTDRDEILVETSLSGRSVAVVRFPEGKAPGEGEIAFREFDTIEEWLAEPSH